MKNKLCITILTWGILIPSLTSTYAEENEKQIIVSEETSQTSFENWLEIGHCISASLIKIKIKR